MPLVSKSIPSLFNGISQQAPALRLPSQAEEQVNCLSSVVEGLKKRPPIEFTHNDFTNLHNSKDDPYSEGYIVPIVYSSSDKWWLVIGRKGNSFGHVYMVNMDDGYHYSVIIDASLTSSSYLNDPDTKRLMLESATLGDTTIIVNNKVTTDLINTPTAAETPTGVVWVKTGVGDTKYEVNVNGNIVSYTTPATGTNTKTDYIAGQLTTLITALSGYTATQKGSLIKVVQDSGLDFTLDTNDGFGNQGLFAVKGSVQKFGDLPPDFIEGITIKLTGESRNQLDSMYVEWVDDSINETGSWVETVAPNSYNDIDPDTMPIKMVRESATSWQLYPCTWNSREVGDATIIPAPSFIGQAITNVFFYKNRLGFLAGENLILSRDGQYFNFWPETASDILDTDPIDLTSSNARITKFIDAVPFDESLIVMSESTQFSLTHDKTLSPKTVSLDVTTEFDFTGEAKPLALGQNLYFSTENTQYSSIMEYYVDSELTQHDAANITGHSPKYLPRGIRTLSGSTSDDILVALSSEELNALYVYKYYWNGDEKIQSSWSKWEVDPRWEIMGAFCYKSKIYLFMQWPYDTFSESAMVAQIDLTAGLTDETWDFRVHLDFRKTIDPLPSNAYDPNTGYTTVSYPKFVPGGDTEFAIVVGEDGGSKAGTVVISSERTGTTGANFLGDWTGMTLYYGKLYNCAYEFSEQFVKDESNAPIASSTLGLRNFMLNYADTGYFKVKVWDKRSPDVVYEYPFTGKVLGAYNLILGENNMSDGEFRFPIMADSRYAKIRIENDKVVPFTIQSAEWEGMYSSRNKRI